MFIPPRFREFFGAYFFRVSHACTTVMQTQVFILVNDTHINSHLH